jgi:hypothetical protein
MLAEVHSGWFLVGAGVLVLAVQLAVANEDKDRRPLVGCGGVLPQVLVEAPRFFLGRRVAPKDAPNVLRLIRFERCLVVFLAAHPELDRLILAPEAVVTTAAAQSRADRESLKCQRSHDGEGQHRPPGKAMTLPLPDQQQPLH